MGRPVEIGADKFVGLRLPEALLKRIDGWAKQKKIEERSNALRQLIERGLEK
jgi:metal-responsive CopG/Arc/MetJ family transcriptional regulator